MTKADLNVTGEGPRITPEDVEANIVGQHFFTAASAARLPPVEGIDFIPSRPVGPLDLLTICVLVLRNGFTVVGKSACASPENFNAEKGCELARADAVRQVWPLLGYELRSKLVFGGIGGALEDLDKLEFIGSAQPITDNDANQLMSFGQALELLKAGAKVARLGWNGKGMWLSLSGPLQGREVQAHAFWSDNNRAYAEGLENKTATVLPAITMKTATGEILMGWLASQSDMLAEDWVLVP